MEWLEAIKHGRETTCNFAYSGVLAEAMLLGNVAERSGETALGRQSRQGDERSGGGVFAAGVSEGREVVTR